MSNYSLSLTFLKNFSVAAFEAKFNTKMESGKSEMEPFFKFVINFLLKFLGCRLLELDTRRIAVESMAEFSQAYNPSAIVLTIFRNQTKTRYVKMNFWHRKKTSYRV